MKRVYFICLFISLSKTASIQEFNELMADDENIQISKAIENATSQRTAKFLPSNSNLNFEILKSKTSLPSVFTFVNFKNDACSTNTVPERKGTCYTHHECKKRGGLSLGPCAWGFGSCCVFSKTCGEIITENCTYFTNPEYDWGSGYIPNGQETCDIRVVKCRPDICQLRLDFVDYDVFGVTNGFCNVDNFAVVGGSSIPSLCGTNIGQHVYINVPPSTDTTTLQVNLDSLAFPGVTDLYERRWNIKVTQIECSNPNLAPPGCLQYHTTRTGRITSFNFGTDVTQSTFGYPNGLNYGVCIKKETGYCSIRYTQNMQFQFGINPNEPNTLTGYTGADCGSFTNTPGGDYVIIPNAEPTNDRYCGGSFPSGGVETQSMPYVLTVVSDSQSYGEGGFMLDFKQQPCP